MDKSRKKEGKISSTTPLDESFVNDTVAIDATSNFPKKESTISMSDLASIKTEPGFTGVDFSHLAENENYRYFRNSKRIGHAVIARDKNGEKVALQYELPKGTTPDTPSVGHLTEIEEIIRYGMTRYRAKGPDNKTYYSTRSDHARTKLDDDNDDTVSVDIAYFSEDEFDKEPFWGSKAEIRKFRDDLNEEDQKDFDAELIEIKPSVKGGQDMVVDPESVRYRDNHRTRKPDQNTLMGESARDAYENFFSAMEDVLSPDFIKILKRAFQADIHKAPENQYRPEWLHAYGFSLTPVEENPQRKNNLGAAAKWANTEMMVLERIAKWFALNQKTPIKITLKSLFDMLLDSELINKIHFEVNIEMQARFVRFIQDLDVFKKCQVFRKASDLAQATGISYAMLNGHPPILKEKITGASIRAEAAARLAAAAANIMETVSELPVGLVPASVQTPSQEGTMIDMVTLSDKAKIPTTLSGDKVMPKSGDKATLQSQFPTYLKQENSIVQLLVTTQEFDYDTPWKGTDRGRCSGTGIVIEHEGEKLILTNAHCVQNQVRTRIRLANDRETKFDTVPVCVSYQADLAILRVTSKKAKFQEIAIAADLGDMVSMNNEVFVKGFPMGGSEISVTKGIVSRIEVEEYSMSGFDMLQVQVDAAINPGNSGGPVFCDDKVVGVAFQGYSSSQSLGYMIPMPIVKHFIQEVFSGKPYRGFPIMPVGIETFENKWQRKYYGMSKEHTGVLVTKSKELGDAYAQLHDKDILLEIDGLKISNQGTVDIPGIGNCIDLLHVTHMKFIGESVKLKVLRKNAVSGISEILDIEVTMDHVPGEAHIVPVAENDKVPTYYINSAFGFVPVSRNYLEGAGSELEEVTFLTPDNKSMHLIDMYKKSPDHQLVAINAVLDCPSTEGYGDVEHKIVKKVNGQEIKNLRHLIEVMESNKGDVHLIEADGRTIVLKNLSPAEMNHVMQQHNIAFDRSVDLRPQLKNAIPVAAIDDDSDSDSESNVVAVKAKTKVAPVMTIAPTASSSSSSSSSSSKNAKPMPTRASKRKRVIEDDCEVADEESLIKAIVGKDGCMPGQRRYMGLVSAMEEHYKNAPQDEDVIDWERISDDEESADEYEPPSKKNRGASVGHIGMFAQKSNKSDESTDLDESSEDEASFAPIRARK